MMRITILAIIILVFCMGTLRGQTAILDRSVKIESTEGTIGSVLDEISRKGGFVFSYNQDIPYDRHVHLQFKRQSVQQFLNELFDGADLLR